MLLCKTPTHFETGVPMNAVEVKNLAASVLAGIAPEANLSSVGESQDLRESLDLDSMDFLNFIIGLSQGSGVSIPESDYPQLFTISGIVRYLTR
jgi:acyl carrier protein